VTTKFVSARVGPIHVTAEFTLTDLRAIQQVLSKIKGKIAVDNGVIPRRSIYDSPFDALLRREIMLPKTDVDAETLRSAVASVIYRAESE